MSHFGGNAGQNHGGRTKPKATSFGQVDQAIHNRPIPHPADCSQRGHRRWKGKRHGTCIVYLVSGNVEVDVVHLSPQVTAGPKSFSSRVAARLRAGFSRPAGHPPAVLPDTPLSALVRRGVTCLNPEMDLDEACDLLLDADLAGAPVVDEEGRAIGVVCLHDLLLATEEAAPQDSALYLAGITAEGYPYPTADGFHLAGMPNVLVVQIMRTAFPRLDISASLSQAAQLLSSHDEPPYAVVTEDSGRVVGMVTRGDIARWVSARLSGHAERTVSAEAQGL